VFGYEEPWVKERNRTESRKATVSEDILITDKKMGGCPRSYKSGKEKRDIRYKKEVMGKYR